MISRDSVPRHLLYVAKSLLRVSISSSSIRRKVGDLNLGGVDCHLRESTLLHFEMAGWARELTSLLVARLSFSQHQQVARGGLAITQKNAVAISCSSLFRESLYPPLR